MSRPISPDTGAGSRRRSRPLVRLLTVCAALGAGLLAPGAAGAAGSRNQDAYRDLGATTRLDWMANIADDTSLAAMSLPGTHDTLSIHGGPITQTQEDFGDSGKTLKAQLEHGIRAIDIRVRISGAMDFTIHHGVVYQKANFRDVLDVTQEFLEKHPSETVVMRLKAECPFKDTVGATECANDPKTMREKDAQSIFGHYVSRFSNLFYSPSVKGDKRAPVPSLKEARGKLVLGSFDSVGNDEYGIETFNKNQEDHWTAYPVQQKWDYVKENVDRAARDDKDEMYVTYTSASKTILRLPFEYAGGYVQEQGGVRTEVQGVNYRLMKYLNAGDSGRVGTVMMDFPGWALVDNIISRNNSHIPKGNGNRAIWLVNSDKTYVNSQYKRCMVRGPEFDSSKSGGLVTQRECQSKAPSSHQWQAEQPKSFDHKGYFQIKTSNGKCLTIPYNNGTPPSAGTQLFWWDCETRWFSGSQMWNVVPTKIGSANDSKKSYRFINNWTNLCLSMDPATASANGGKVTQDTCPK
ncbi:phosphatidylinositol-specific phospholipase C domain-containing protein [Streptomyces monomycini]|uniref:phosphatidylinositol-specific phospholipase C domain-containing protein n=1 Tax=Streptomyces monomycini TaxID=371720 RepID=UPI00067C604A|nr:phosphatidylinositol-specific phospholipase C domain-containing protein [Streptomyces monomycini]